MLGGLQADSPPGARRSISCVPESPTYTLFDGLFTPNLDDISIILQPFPDRRSSTLMSSTYIHGFSASEQARLLAQADALASVVFGGLDLADAHTLLEVGCGVGAQTRQLLMRWPHMQIHAIDQSPSHLAAAAEHLRAARADGQVRLTRARAERLPLAAAQFDAALTIWVLEHVPEPAQILAEMVRVLKPGGRVILTEVDNSTFRFFPHNPLIEDWWAQFNAVQRQSGADPFIGQQLAALAQAAGLTEICVTPLPIVSSRQTPQRRLALLRYTRDLLLSGADSLKRAGRVSEADEQALLAEFAALEARPEVDFQYLAVRLCARKP